MRASGAGTAAGLPSRDPTLLFLLPLAALLRLWHLGRESLWLDEIGAAATAAHPIGEFPAELSWHVSPPLDYVVLHLWQAVGGSGTWLRLPAVAWSVASVAFLYLAVRRLGFPRAALPAALILTLSVPSIAYAQEARMYSLFVLGATVLLYALARVMEAPLSRGSWALAGLAAAASLYTHYYAALLLVAVMLPVLVLCMAHRSWRILAAAATTGGLVTLAFAPWVPIVLAQYRIRQGGLAYALPREVYWEVMLPYVNGGVRGAWLWVMLAAFLVGLAVVTARSLEKGALLAAFTVVPILLAVWVPPFARAITPRNLLFVLPGYHAAMAVGLTVPVVGLLRWLAGPGKRQGEAGRGPAPEVVADAATAARALPAAAGVVMVLVVVLWPTWDLLTGYYDTGWWMKDGNTDWREAAALLDRQVGPGDVIVTDDRYTRYLLAYYLDRDSLGGLSLDPYVQNAAHTLPTRGERFPTYTLAAPPALLRQGIAGASTVWFVRPDPGQEVLLGIGGGQRTEVTPGLDLPVVALDAPEVAAETRLQGDELALVAREGWSSRRWLRDGAFLRWLEGTGTLRLPVWSTLGTTARLRLFVAPEHAGIPLRLTAGRRSVEVPPPTVGWQDVELDLANLPDRDGWVSLELGAVSADASPAAGLAIGATGIRSPVPIIAEGSTHEAARFAHFRVGGTPYSWADAGKGYPRGYNLVAIDPISGEVFEWAVFDTHGDLEAGGAMAGFLDALPDGTIVAGAVMDDGSTRLGDAALAALARLGCAVDIRGRFRASHAFVGVKGAPPGTAAEDGLGFQARVVVGPDPTPHAVGLHSVELATGARAAERR